jgi:hypothetical protein
MSILEGGYSVLTQKTSEQSMLLQQSDIPSSFEECRAYPELTGFINLISFKQRLSKD